MNRRQVFRVTSVEDVLIVELLGVVSSLADDAIMHELDAVRLELRTGGFLAVVIDLGQVAYFGSSMLEAIRGLWNELSPRQGQIVLCNASEVSREVLQIAKFDHLWPIVDTRAEALKLLKS